MNTIKMLFKKKKIILMSTVFFLNWYTNMLVYDGFNFNTGYLVGDPYLNFTLSALMELFAILVVFLTVNNLNRKIPYALNMFSAGITLLSIQFIPKSDFNNIYFFTVL